jgi:hypothetical protein
MSDGVKYAAGGEIAADDSVLAQRSGTRRVSGVALTGPFLPSGMNARSRR